jgi:hypothetical protein
MIIVHFSCQDKKKKKKKHKQLIISSNSTMIYLHELRHVKESMSAHLSKLRITEFGHQEVFHASF